MSENKKYIAEDEIDLVELFKIVAKKKWFIVIFTCIVTLLAVAYAFMKTPLYEVKSNVQIGFIGNKLLVNPEILQQKLKIIFHLSDKLESNKKFIAEVSDISLDKKIKNFLYIETIGISNEAALSKSKSVVQYIKKQDKRKIDEYVRNTKNKIIETKNAIKYIDEVKIKNIEREIGKLKTQKIVKIDEKIKQLQSQNIQNIKRNINLIKTQQIVKIDEKINFLQNDKMIAIDNKIKYNKDKLKQYNNSVQKIYSNSNKEDITSKMISSIQMVNYQNLILNSQNKIEDLKIEKNTINKETIPSLQVQKNNLINVTIKDLEQKIKNINDVTIADLQRQKLNITNDTIKNLEDKINITLKDNKTKLQENIKNLEYKLSESNIQNSRIVGEYVVHDHPIKPKKRLIVVVAFITGLILSIFLIFFMEFIKNNEEKIMDAK